MMGSSPWTMTPTQPLSPSCLTPAPCSTATTGPFGMHRDTDTTSICGGACFKSQKQSCTILPYSLENLKSAPTSLL